jgi:hypothetical protein
VDAYCYDFGVQEYIAEIIAGYPRYEDRRCCGIVVAESRGKAKRLAVDHEWHDTYVEWTTPMHLRLIEKDVQGPSRVVEALDDPAFSLWDEAGNVLDEIDKQDEKNNVLEDDWNDFLEEEGQELVATFGDLD